MGKVLLRSILLALLLGSIGLESSGPQPANLQIWRREITGVQSDPPASDDPLAVGSIQKPFVAKAWAGAHPGEAPPRLRCGADSRCWLHPGHGELDLSRAVAVSCNAYFRSLAEATPSTSIAATFRAEGFSGEYLTPDSAIGLRTGRGAPAIRPSALLEAYVRLVKSPWPVGESVRQQVLAGLRDAARRGTASLGRRGFWAKTGTLPLEGDPLHTQGFVIAVDDSGWAILGRLPRGTGSGAAAALPLDRLRPWTMPRTPPATGLVSSETARRETAFVRVRMLDLLGSTRFIVRNAGSGPVSTRHGYLGPGGTLELSRGSRVGPGLLDLQTPESGLLRRLNGELTCLGGSGRAPTLIATLSLREYADGVIAAELPQAAPSRRIELGAAVLRFLERNHRHQDADVCDSTHCAWFIGRGPRLVWTQDLRPRGAGQGKGQASANGADPPTPLTEEEWAAIRAAAQRPGPSQWSTHCGGTPLSPHAVWGYGNLEAPPCPRHGGADTRSWVREWKTEDLAAAFGGAVENLEIGHGNGVWELQISRGAASKVLRYDDAHRALAKVLGWGALPSPADRLEAIPGGFRATGVGLGHRVGLCLGE